MKYIISITLLLQFNLSTAQNNQNDEEKPSWSEELPEMLDTPDINIDPNIDTKIEFDMDELRMDRSEIFGDSEEETNERPDLSSEDDPEVFNNQTDQEDQLAEQELADQAAAEQTALEKAAAEQAALEQAALEQAAQEKAEQEKAALEQAALEQAALEQAALEQAALEQAALEQAALEQAALEQAQDENQTAVEISEDLISVESTLETDNSPVQTSQNIDNVDYGWDIIVNVTPKYPLRAARTSEEGWVDIKIEINSNGDVVSSEVVDSYRNSNTFHRAAIDAVEGWKFDPPSKYGINQNLFKTYKILFKL